MYYKWTEQMRDLKKCFSNHRNSDYIFSGETVLDNAYFCKYNIHGLLNKILPYIYNITRNESSINFILSPDDKKNNVLLEYVNLLNIQNIHFYKAHEIRFVKDLIRLPVSRDKMQSVRDNKLYTAEWLQRLRQLIKSPKHIKKLVILRKDKHRHFQEDLLNFLLKEGFCPVVLDDLSIQEEIDLFAGVEIVVGNHGSGLSNLIYCSPGTKILEITRGDFQYIYPDFVSHTNNLLNLTPEIYYQQVLCDSDIDMHIEKTPFTNIDRFIREYSYFLEYGKDIKK
jgi:hypothetical protein